MQAAFALLAVIAALAIPTSLIVRTPVEEDVPEPDRAPSAAMPASH